VDTLTEVSAPEPLSRTGEVVVIGAGIAGCTVAHALALRDLKVTLVDQHSLAWGASSRNMGLLLNEIDPEAYDLMRSALAIYRQLDDSAVDFALRECDTMLVPQDEPQLEVTRRRAEALRAHGIDCTFVEAQWLRRELPQVRAGLPGGYRLPGTWVVDPAAATRAFAEAARVEGAHVLTGVRVGQIVTRSGRFEGVVTDQGRIGADACVLATGPWLQELLPSAPVFAGRGWLLRTAELGFELPWVLVEMAWPDLDELGRASRPPTLAEVAAGGYDEPVAATVAIVPQPAGGALVGTSLAPSLRDPVEGVEMPRRVAERARSLVPGLAQVSVTASWYGMRPMSPDGMPLVGAAPVEGVYLHAGHGSMGMQAAPATAGWLATLMVDRRQAPELERLRPDRFSGVPRR
jgi:glycine/D-amino acid oxidase-like deaminating enzyme